jgi:UDPglucose 6-dehydrogenase
MEMGEARESAPPVKVAVLGTGHVGLVTAVTFAGLGHEVVGIDDDPAKVELLRRSRAPFFEPGLQEMLQETIARGHLRFSGRAADGVPGADVAFICVGTPARPDGRTNMRAVERAAEEIRRVATTDLVVVHKSTVPVQTGDRVRAVLNRNPSRRFSVVSNPEFLREGQALRDALHPDRIVVGAEDARGQEVMRALYAPLVARGVAYFETDIRTAELAKHACNAFLATKISYANALARLCEAAGADVVAIADIMGADSRIGRAFLDAGMGFGGYCLPKDIAAFQTQAARLGYDFGLLAEVEKINGEAVESVFRKVEEAVWTLEGKRIVLLGLAFKAGTDDVRESPSLRLARLLLEAGASVVGHDPQANDNASSEVPDLEVADDPYAAAEGAHCLVICTPWQEFASLDFPRLKGLVAEPILVDGRNLLEPAAAREAGFEYVATGRPEVAR